MASPVMHQLLDGSPRVPAQAAARRLLVAGIEAFSERGYHATTTRAIAARADMSPAAVYVHYRSKEALLFAISRIGHESALRAVLAARDSTAEPVPRLRAVVRAHVGWHARHHTMARVIQYELCALSEPHQ